MRRSIEEHMDRAEIHELHARYCRGLDRLDRDLLRSIFHPDAFEEHSPWFSGLAYDWIDSAIQESTSRLRGMMFHFISNELIEIKGDFAVAEVYVINVNRYSEISKDYFLFGRYVERLERRDGEWRIAWRARLTDIIRLEDATQSWHADWPPPADHLRGIRGHDDL